MAIFVTPRSEVAQAVAAIWGLQLGNQTMSDVLSMVAAPGGSVGSVVSGAYNASFGSATNAAVAAAFVNNLGITGAAAPGAEAYVVGQLAASTNKGATLVAIAKAFGNLSNTGDASVDALVAAFNAKVAAAVTYSSTAGTADVSMDALPSSTSFDLTNDRDALTGTSGADTFHAYVFDNWNTLQSGDSINGGAGFDTLEATLGDSSQFAILPLTQSVEAMFFRSQANNEDGNDGDNNVSAGGVADGNMDDNTIDAELMRGVEQWWNTDSRADLVIEDIRIADDEITEDIAIGWANADPASNGEDDADKVDYEVYFSPESLRKESSSTSNAIQLTVGNQVEEVSFDSTKPLKDLPYTAVQFLVNGQSVVLQLDFTGVETYAQFNAQFTTAFDAAKAAGQYATLLADVTLKIIANGDTFLSRDGQSRTADVIELTKASGTIAPASLGWLADRGLPSNNAFSANVEAGAAIVTSTLITSTVFLDNVGRESESGDLVIGSMSTRTGVERFDITVLNNDNTSGAYTSSGNWVGEMRSTNNFLREVLAKNDADGIGSPDYLYIGTGMDQAGNNLTEIRDTFKSTQSTVDGFLKYKAAVDAALLNPDGLKDVRLFDASAMVGNVKVGAIVTDDAIRKYQDLVDTNPADGVDDVSFVYSTGSNNDSVNLVLDEDLWDNDGSQSSNNPGRHDFKFTVNGNAGNDHIQVTIGGEDDNSNGDGGSGENWYANQKINANITINGGSGNDTIRTPGAGDMVINAGSGNDAVYADNTGGEDFDYNEDRAAWVFNATNDNVSDLKSEGAASVSAVNALLTVDFRGFSKTVGIAGSVDSTSNKSITDLTINQAIKDAINNDGVLSKLLVAEDGPGRTLIVRSLIDGDVNSLDVTFSNKALTTQQSASALALTLFDPTSGTTAMGSLLDGYLVADYISGNDGEDSNSTSDNKIEGGTGDDVIVLGTTDYLVGFYNFADGSNDTVVYSGLDNGRDTIVNFDTTYDGFSEQYVSDDDGELQEEVSLVFTDSDGDPAAQTIVFDGQTITLSAPATQGVIPAEDVAYQFAQQINESSSLWTAAHTVLTDEVTLTRIRFGELDDVVAGDFTGTYFTAGGGTVTPTLVTDGANGSIFGVESEFTVTFSVPGTAAATAGAFTFDGANIAYNEGDGAITLTDLVANGVYPNWTAVQTDDNEVTFTAIAVGATAIGTAADFDLGTNTIVGSIAGDVGADDADGGYVTIQTDGPGNGFDYLNFASYKAAGVMVNGVVLVDKAGDGITVTSPAAEGKTYQYIKMTESTTNEGEYTIQLVTVDDDTPVSADTVQLIGVADFGDDVEVNFVTENFII